MNLGELRKMTENLSDDVEIITTSENYEIMGSWVEFRSASLVRVKKTRREFKDDFDGGRYFKDVYVPRENGIEVLKL